MIERTSDFLNVLSHIEALVQQLNIALRYHSDDKYRVTFGYIGNDDDIRYSVFLPHPWVSGTADDRIGSFTINDVRGAQMCVSQLYTWLGAIKFMRSSTYSLSISLNNQAQAIKEAGL